MEERVLIDTSRLKSEHNRDTRRPENFTVTSSLPSCARPRNAQVAPADVEGSKAASRPTLDDLGTIPSLS